MRHKQSQIVSWLILFVICLSAFGIYVYRHRPAAFTGAESASPDRPGPSRSFLLLRMPEITTQYESGIETMKSRIDAWMKAVIAAGYHPMLLSDAIRRLEHDRGLPERSVVFFYSPCYRKTYEIVSPIHSRNRFPAAALTDKTAMKRADRRYLTFHAVRKMRKTGAWDTGFLVRQDGFLLQDEIEGKWSAVAGAIALNRKNDLARLNYLNVNANWNAAELVNRLRAESAAERRVYLSKAVIHSREWGVALDRSPRNETSFDLIVPRNKRGTKLFWLNTLASRDFNVKLYVHKLNGELWLQLLHDEDTDSGINLIMSNNRVIAEERINSVRNRLLSLPLQQSLTKQPFNLMAAVTSNTLTVTIAGKTIRTACHAAVLPTDKGTVQLYLTDKLRGVASARGIRMTFTPREKRMASRI